MIDPESDEEGGEKEASKIRLPSLHSHSGASSRKGDGEKREDGGRGLLL